MDYFKGDLTPKRTLLFIFMFFVGIIVLKIIIGLLPLGIFLFIILAPPIYVLADAQERKNPRPVLWAVFTLFTSIFGLLVYLLARPEMKGKSYCQHCGREVDEAFHNCPWCGKSLQASLKCANCSGELKPAWRFCPSCRTAVGTPAPAEPQVSTAASQ
ncbi:MAG: zinc ribbon domain-containing protein [Candidatus Riflebacteria bacterium]|nr:zinc ribbon domain-containing protein [Candidatus Riflebacteria bacterium]